MKKILVFVCILFSIFVFSTTTMNAQTFENDNLLTSSIEVITYDDGSYLVISLFVNDDIIDSNQDITSKNSYIKIGHKDATHYHSDGSIL